VHLTLRERLKTWRESSKQKREGTTVCWRSEPESKRDVYNGGIREEKQQEKNSRISLISSKKEG
jgi:hypothetical protein